MRYTIDPGKERRQKQIDDPNGPNPFVDDEAWAAYLDDRRRALLAFMADPANL